MLPFTKRPGRGEESEEVLTREDIPSKPSSSIRPPKPSFSDDELTNLMPTKALGDAVSSVRPPSPLPAAGRPATVPPPRSSARPASIPPPPRSSVRPPPIDEEDDEGRTVVRGAPKIVKRSKRPPQMNTGENVPTTLSPAAVIKQTLESARAAKMGAGSDHLMPGPPKDLLEDHADVHPADAGPQGTVMMPQSARSQPPPPISHTGQMAFQPTMHASMPPGSVRPPPPSAPPPMGSQPPMAYPNPYGAIPSGSVSVPGMAMSQSAPLPAHFMNPQSPMSDGRIDPPGTAVTSRTKVSGRPAMSWAAALLAFGLFVGVGAVAVMQGSADGLVDTTASFVDPARAGAKPATPVAVQPPVAAAQPQPVAPPDPAPQPPVAVNAVGAGGLVGVSTPAPVTPPPPAVDPKPADPQPQAKADPPPKKPVVRFVRPPAPPPPPKTEAPEKPEVAAAPPEKPAKPAKPAKPGKPEGGGTDDETKKALEQLQKAQLEQSM